MNRTQVGDPRREVLAISCDLVGIHSAWPRTGDSDRRGKKDVNKTITQAPAFPQCGPPTVDDKALAGIANKSEQGSILELLSCNHISVQEAACRLNVSPSRIYRMDRSNGPFPIFKSGWRVWIELAGIEAFMAGKKSALAGVDSELPAAPGVEATQTPTGTEDQQGSTAYGVVPDATPVTIAPACFPRVEPMFPAQRFGGGQRDLLFAWAYRPNWL